MYCTKICAKNFLIISLVIVSFYIINLTNSNIILQQGGNTSYLNLFLVNQNHKMQGYAGSEFSNI